MLIEFEIEINFVFASCEVGLSFNLFTYSILSGKFSKMKTVVLLLDVQVFVDLPNSGVGKKILILGIRNVCLWSNFFLSLGFEQIS